MLLLILRNTAVVVIAVLIVGLLAPGEPGSGGTEPTLAASAPTLR
jgi:hypothetical protein